MPHPPNNEQDSEMRMQNKCDLSGTVDLSWYGVYLVSVDSSTSCKVLLFSFEEEIGCVCVCLCVCLCIIEFKHCLYSLTTTEVS